MYLSHSLAFGLSVCLDAFITVLMCPCPRVPQEEVFLAGGPAVRYTFWCVGGWVSMLNVVLSDHGISEVSVAVHTISIDVCIVYSGEPCRDSDTVPRLPETVPQLRTETVPQLRTETVPQLLTETVPQLLPETVPQLLTETVPQLLTETVPQLLTETVPQLLPETVPQLLPETVPQLRCAPTINYQARLRG